MEAVVVETKSKRKTALLLKLSEELGLRSKKISAAAIEELFLAQSIKEGLKSGYTTKEKVLKALKK
jgi:hypothetical protein